jgi:hypothetical protein
MANSLVCIGAVQLDVVAMRSLQKIIVGLTCTGRGERPLRDLFMTDRFRLPIEVL